MLIEVKRLNFLTAEAFQGDMHIGTVRNYIEFYDLRIQVIMNKATDVYLFIDNKRCYIQPNGGCTGYFDKNSIEQHQFAVIIKAKKEILSESEFNDYLLKLQKYKDD